LQAIILAAGTGSRLGQGQPKCLCEIGGRTLLEHQLAALEAVDVEPVVVVGYRDEDIRALLPDVRVVLNDRYATTNSLYSFHLAETAIDGDALIFNSDVLFDPAMLDALLARGTSALVCDSTSGDAVASLHPARRVQAGDVGVSHDRADEPAYLIASRDGALLQMRKDLPPAQCVAENVGLLYLDHAALDDAFTAARSMVYQGRGHKEWLASAINRIAWRHPITCVDIAGMPWIEIDYPHDLAHAQQQIWPEIALRQPRAAQPQPIAT